MYKCGAFYDGCPVRGSKGPCEFPDRIILVDDSNEVINSIFVSRDTRCPITTYAVHVSLTHFKDTTTILGTVEAEPNKIPRVAGVSAHLVMNTVLSQYNGKLVKITIEEVED